MNLPVSASDDNVVKKDELKVPIIHEFRGQIFELDLLEAINLVSNLSTLIEVYIKKGFHNGS